MNRWNIILFFTVFTIFTASSQSRERLFQFINSSDNNTVSIDIGTTPGVTFTSSKVDLSFQYSFLFNSGISISTDLFIFNGALKLDELEIGIGGGIIIRPSLEGFSSDITLRVPIKYGLEKYSIVLIPYSGMSMFKEKNNIVFGLHCNFSPKFYLNSQKKAAKE